MQGCGKRWLRVCVSALQQLVRVRHDVTHSDECPMLNIIQLSSNAINMLCALEHSTEVSSHPD